MLMSAAHLSNFPLFLVSYSRVHVAAGLFKSVCKGQQRECGHALARKHRKQGLHSPLQRSHQARRSGMLLQAQTTLFSKLVLRHCLCSVSSHIMSCRGWWAAFLGMFCYWPQFIVQGRQQPALHRLSASCGWLDALLCGGRHDDPGWSSSA